MSCEVKSSPAIIFSLTKSSDHFNIKHVMVCTRLLNANVKFKEINLFRNNEVTKGIVVEDTRENLIWVKQQLDSYGQSSLIFRDEDRFARHYNTHELSSFPLGYLIKTTEDYAKEQPFWTQCVISGQYYSVIHD